MKVYKYRGGPEVLTRDLVSLRADKLYAAPIDRLNDPHEARILVNHKEIRVSDLFIKPHTILRNGEIDSEQNFQNNLRSLLERVRKCGIYSLSKTHSSELLWAYYGDSHRGFCIEYDLELLIEHHLRCEYRLDVRYQDDLPSITSEDLPELMCSTEEMLTRLIATKSTPWLHEDEIRIITNEPGLYGYDYRAVTGIYFGCQSTESNIKTTMEHLAGRDIKYYRMSPDSVSYSYLAEPIADEYESTKKYRESLAPVEEGVPFIGPDEEAFKDELLAAVERTRRDPYCSKVILPSKCTHLKSNYNCNRGESWHNEKHEKRRNLNAAHSILSIASRH